MATEGGEQETGGLESGEHAQDTASVAKPLPLGSRRLKAIHVKQIAASLSLPTTGSTDEVRLIVEGRLVDMGKEPQHVQVVMCGTKGSHLQLRDVDGVFLDVLPEEEGKEDSEGDGGGHSSGESAGSEDDDVAEVRLALQHAHNLNRSLQEEVSSLKEQLGREKCRVKEMWHENCEQFTLVR